MNCIETKKNIEALQDGELDDVQRDAIEHHLWTCTPCLELKEQMSSLSNLLLSSQFAAPSVELDERIVKSFKNNWVKKTSGWRRIVFGAFVVPKPVFAALFVMALAGLWAAFEVGKFASATVSMMPPFVEIPAQTPPEKIVQTVFVEVPVIREKTVTRTVFVREQKISKNEKAKTSPKSRQNDLPSYSSTVAENGYFTGVSLKGFEPSPEISAKIIKEVKENEK